ncbi:unnamed protein product [Rotaria sp. Silwood1]|nr:unnamed protein product [Rotaria sp. Silwood1]CAF4760251.1 unnamed protein product [Rotaria sp. Silwood1]
MDEMKSEPHLEDNMETNYVDPLIALLIPKPTMTLGEHFDRNTDKIQDKGCCLRFDNACCSMFGRWWNVRNKWQRELVRFIEQPLFHIIIIALVLIDCLLMITEFILDFITLKKPCDLKNLNHTIAHDGKEMYDRIEFIAGILDYCSLALLTVFVVEIFVKVYAFGRHWWNFHEKKMEWLDATIVMASFVIDLITIRRDNLFAGIPLLFISLRLWRFIGLINDVAQTIRSQDENKKKQLSTNYHEVINVLLAILGKKTVIISELGREMTLENYNDVLKKCETIDESCRTILGNCPHPSSLDSIMEMNHHLLDAIGKLRLTLFTISPSSSKNIDN